MTRAHFKFSFALLLIACGASKPNEPPPENASTAAARDVPPPLPVEPLRLLPANVRELGSVNLKELRASPHFALAESWLRRFGCLHAEPSHFLLERTDRLVFATYAAGASARVIEPLVILRGDYRTGDVERALAQARSLLGTPAEPSTEQARGRFQVRHAGDLSGAQVGEHLIVVGAPGRVLAALDVADAKQDSFDTTDELMRGLDTQQWLSSHSVAAITRVNERTAQRLGRQLSVIGGRRLGEDLNDTSAALGFVLARDLELLAHVLYADARTAAGAADSLRSVLGRADLVLRLTGLPSTLDRARVDAQGERLQASLKLSAEEVAALSERLMPLLDESAPPCGALSSAPEPAGPAVTADESQAGRAALPARLVKPGS